MDDSNNKKAKMSGAFGPKLSSSIATKRKKDVSLEDFGIFYQIN